MSASIIVVSGEGRYSDPWHRFAETSARVAQLLNEQGYQVSVCGAATTEPREAELIIVDAGGGEHVPPVPGDAEDQWHEAVLAHAGQGKPVLALHAAANTFYDDDRWATVLGGRWVRGVSWHPTGGPTFIDVAPTEHPVLTGLPARVETVDERYSDLELRTEITPLLTHTEEGVTHPLAWVHDAAPFRVIYDGLGHDTAAYGPTRADLLQREVSWLLG